MALEEDLLKADQVAFLQNREQVGHHIPVRVVWAGLTGDQTLAEAASILDVIRSSVDPGLVVALVVVGQDSEAGDDPSGAGPSEVDP